MREFLEGLETSNMPISNSKHYMVREFLEGLETHVAPVLALVREGGARVPRRA